MTSTVLRVAPCRPTRGGGSALCAIDAHPPNADNPSPAKANLLLQVIDLPFVVRLP